MTIEVSRTRGFAASIGDLARQAREAGWNFWRPYVVGVIAVGLLTYPLL